MANYAILSKPDSPKAVQATKRLRDELTKNPLKDYPHPIVFAVGGDGTLLSAIRQHLHDGALFVGVSAGTLGFMMSITPDQIPDIIKAINEATFSSLAAPLLKVTYRDSDQVLGYAFNDISVERRDSQAVKFELAIDGSTGSFIGDGVIFSTPLGSTAYSLSAGGPIIDSMVQDSLVVTPNNPHVSSLYSSLQRPHVLHRSRQVDIIFDSQAIASRPARLLCDGHNVLDNIQADISISLSDKTIQLAQLNADSFHNQIEAKRLGRN